MATELDTVLNLYKRKSETPLQTIGRYVALHPEFARTKTRMTYAGRLDPMAEGVLVVLAGERNLERDAFTGLDKDYEFEFILGIETDTFDVLGRIVSAHGAGTVDEAAVRGVLGRYLGRFEQKYPPYSSKVVDGIPLYRLARQGKLADINIPTHMVEVARLELVSSRQISRQDLLASVRSDISALEGDFRQRETLEDWDEYAAGERGGASIPDTFTVYKARVSCGSGFYVRQLVSDIGRDLGTGAIVISILRTRVGNFYLKDSIK